MNSSRSTNLRPAPSLMHRVRRIHLVGIGGAGMSGIAEVLANLDFDVSGSDQQASAKVEQLRAQGIDVTIGHHAENISEADVVVSSSAIPADNVELIEAGQRRIPVVPRAEMLGELMRFRQGIAVAGTHGKTTTTSLIAGLLDEAGMDPTFVIGGLVNAFGSNARLGQGRYLVAEADESDGSFLRLQPVISLITNIDRDHLDAYQGSFDQLQAAFLQFLHHLPFFGVAVLCIEDPHVAELVPKVGRTVVTYGFDESADVRGSDIQQSGQMMQFKLWLPEAEEGLDVTLGHPGRHNVLNALGAAAVGWELSLSPAQIVAGLNAFAGIGRRFAAIGDQGRLTFGTREVLGFEDYGHHPTELDAVIQAVRDGWPDRRLVLVFQPHRYSRTRDQFDAFSRVLAQVDVLILADIYTAGETEIAGIDADTLAAAVARRNSVQVERITGWSQAEAALDSVLEDQDLLLVMGAGDIGRVAVELKSSHAVQAQELLS
ncbi:MAG: UDP-N-acetylmuramate--L-alanine ligase [Pseudomonadota bacterium]